MFFVIRYMIFAVLTLVYSWVIIEKKDLKWIGLVIYFILSGLIFLK